MKKIQFPECCLVLLVGPSGSGKSTFARQHFKPTEVVSSDYCRGMVSDDENSLEASKDAFALLNEIISIRLRRGLLTVVDATNVQPESRQTLIAIARKYHVQVAAILFELPEKVCIERNALRSDRNNLSAEVIRSQLRVMHRYSRKMSKEGVRHISVIKSEADANEAVIERTKLWNNRKEERGPFDIIGDVHGCYVELCELLNKLGYSLHNDVTSLYSRRVNAPAGRRVIFVGDLVDRGPDSPAVLRLVMSMVNDGIALCVPGNHDSKLVKYLDGKEVKLKHGLEQTVQQLEGEPEEFRKEVRKFLDGLVSHLVLDEGNLVVAHAGLREDMQGRASGAVRSFCLYGETTGEIDDFGLPVRHNWALEYAGKAMVVYGHTPVPRALWLNNTIDIDTGCVFGGKLSALRYPERELVELKAHQEYYAPSRPLIASPLTLESPFSELPDLADISGKRHIETQHSGMVTIRQENGIAALEVMSRFAVDPRWLVYLPPTMSPCETSSEENYLEHPLEAFRYYASKGVDRVICEVKHMGSRAVIVICKDTESAAKRFGIDDGRMGCIYTRTGRPFFSDEKEELAVLERIRAAMTASGFWDRFETGFAVLDCEIMPWSAKAQSLITDQYGAVYSSGAAHLKSAEKMLSLAAVRGLPVAPLLSRTCEKISRMEKYAVSYKGYCWPVKSIDDYRIAPFHLLATELKTHLDESHLWHLEELGKICEKDGGILKKTACLEVAVMDEVSLNKAVAWWKELTLSGKEGMVVKPVDFVSWDKDEVVQPAVKCRGPEYLRIIYGPDYDLPENLVRLRKRGLSHKRSMARREFALGAEALERFVRRESLRRVHECVFGVLALESEPVDPRL